MIKFDFLPLLSHKWPVFGVAREEFALSPQNLLCPPQNFEHTCNLLWKVVSPLLDTVQLFRPSLRTPDCTMEWDTHFPLQALTWLCVAHEGVAVSLDGTETVVTDVKVTAHFALVAGPGDGTHVTRVTPATTATQASPRRKESHWKAHIVLLNNLSSHTFTRAIIDLYEHVKPTSEQLLIYMNTSSPQRFTNAHGNCTCFSQLPQIASKRM